MEGNIYKSMIWTFSSGRNSTLNIILHPTYRITCWNKPDSIWICLKIGKDIYIIKQTIETRPIELLHCLTVLIVIRELLQ